MSFGSQPKQVIPTLWIRDSRPTWEIRSSLVYVIGEDWSSLIVKVVDFFFFFFFFFFFLRMLMKRQKQKKPE